MPFTHSTAKTINDTASVIYNGARAELIIENIGAADCRIGNNAVSSTDGKLLRAGASLSVNVSAGEALYGIRTTSTNTTVDYLART